MDEQVVKKDILLVDDNLSFLKSMQLALRRIGLRCQISQNLQMARDFLSQKNYDLVICDYFMPDCDGKSALDELGSLNRNCLLVLTSSYPLDMEFKKSDRFVFVDKLSLLEWIANNHVEYEAV
jgi:DNA-binding NtrC family response regulator